MKRSVNYLYKKSRRGTSHKYVKRRKYKRNYNSSDDSDDSDYTDESNHESKGSTYVDGKRRSYRNWFFNTYDEITVKGNHIWFTPSVSKRTTNKLIRIIHDKNLEYNESRAELSEYANLTPKPIYLHINSYGGDLLAVMAVIDTIRNSQIPIHTIIEGCSASAATLMSVVGHKRLITENSFMLIHQLSSGFNGKMNEIEDDFQNNKVFMKRIEDLYETTTKMTKEEIKKALKHDLWWDAKTCLEKGLVDEIVTESYNFNSYNNEVNKVNSLNVNKFLNETNSKSNLISEF
jgi:ATP-dependent Clp protease protease subunit